MTIKIKVQGFYKTSELEISPNATVRDCKRAISPVQNVPISAQIYLFHGRVLYDDTQLDDAGLTDDSVITMVVTPEFVERVHPWHLRDPLTGLLFNKPTRCTDRYTYNDASLKLWVDSLKGQVLLSPMTREVMHTRDPCVDTTSDVQSYLENFDVTAPPEHKSLDSLGRLQTILGHLRHVVSKIPRNKIPHIVSLGGESIGKSITLEGITMMPVFPYGENRCTRMPVEVRYRQGPSQLPVFRVIRGKGMRSDLSEEEDEKRENGEECIHREVVALQRGRGELQHQMSEIMNRIARRYDNQDEAPGICSDLYLVLDLVGPTYPDLNLVDLPGDAANDHDIIKETMKNHFQRFGENSFYLHMSKATQFTEDGPFSTLDEFRDVDILKRTIGVVTHIDMADSIADHPNRLAQLQDLAKGVINVEGASFGDHILPNGTFFVMNREDHTLDAPSGLEPAYNRRQRETEFLSTPAWTDVGLSAERVGTNALIGALQRMHFLRLEQTYIPSVMCDIQSHQSTQHMQNRALGVPAIVSPLPEEEHEVLLGQIVDGIMETLHNNMPAIMLRFDREHIQPLEEELLAVLTSPEFDLVERLRVHDIIAQTRDTIMAIFEAQVEDQVVFWLNEFECSLEEDASDFRLGRFTVERDIMKTYLEGKLAEAFGQRIDTLVIAFLARAEQNVRVCSVRDEHDTVPMVKIIFDIDADTLAHTMCGSLREFYDMVFNAEELRHCLQDCSLIEGCRNERLVLRNELLLCQMATEGVLDMAYQYGSTRSLLCHNRRVAIYHIPTNSFLQVYNRDDTNEGEDLVVTTKVCYEFDVNTSHELSNRDWEQFQVIDTGDGKIAFKCPAFPNCYLGITEEGSVVSMRDNGASQYQGALKFEARFHTQYDPASGSNTLSSRSVTLHNTASNGYLRVLASEDESGAVTHTINATAPTLFPDSLDEVFVVVSNPEQYWGSHY